jgi:SAM-dependent methyltransferase
MRYIEFPFALSCLPNVAGNCLDISSPRLFSLYVAKNHRTKSLTIVNPDPKDIAATVRSVDALNLRDVTTRVCAVHELLNEAARYDCIWSISVIEHIAGDYDDREAVRYMYGALAPGGRLILTIPVDRRSWDEHRRENYYGTSPARGETFFFQRWYDDKAIQDRIVRSIGVAPTILKWFGETEAGFFTSMEKQWMEKGQFATVDDQRQMTENFREYESWDGMPGQGVCGLMFTKPLEATATV